MVGASVVVVVGASVVVVPAAVVVVVGASVVVVPAAVVVVVGAAVVVVGATVVVVGATVVEVVVGGVKPESHCPFNPNILKYTCSSFDTVDRDTVIDDDEVF